VEGEVGAEFIVIEGGRWGFAWVVREELEELRGWDVRVDLV
jgi:hypothetical protein